MKNILNTPRFVYKIVSQIPEGRVVTYKQIASITGIKTPRLVGRILHENKHPDKIPCHRVIHTDGTLAENYAFGGLKIQKRKLLSEGIKFNKNKIISDYRWDFSLPITNNLIH